MQPPKDFTESQAYRYCQFMKLRATAEQLAEDLRGVNGVVWSGCGKRRMAEAYATKERHMRKSVTITELVYIKLLHKYGTR